MRRKPQKAAELQAVIVRWSDASTQLDHEATLSDPASIEAFGGAIEVEDIGWLIKKDRKHVVLALGRCLEDETIRQATTIPRSWVKEIIELAPSRPETGSENAG